VHGSPSFGTFDVITRQAPTQHMSVHAGCCPHTAVSPAHSSEL